MGKNGPLGRGDDGRGTRVRVVGPSRARPAALKGATGRIGKIPTYVKRSRALKSARSFSPKFRAAVCSFSPGNSVRGPSRRGRTSENGHHNMVDGSDTSAGMAGSDAVPAGAAHARDALRAARGS